MEFYTLLTIVYLMGGQTLETKILFASEDDFCEVSHIPSHIVKPKLRPQ